ncbi:response regulator [Desulfovibrio mangrovi]|uniref:response regulator n=1 Tax=Desulfovibrio mangrovi TaxID=2976983 RepID=UPI00224641F1|nr:response regulator [Desulfovibrio mangrovi]UZP66271.1 response regulator [Desulfovibrio mangrovi]
MSETYTMADAPRTVLIIEDSHVQSKIISKQITALTQFETVIANTMEEARHLLETAREHLFIAVIDLNLPDAPDGEAVDLCLEHGVPSVVLTATFNENIRKRFLERNVSDYFFKGTIQDMDPLMYSLERVFKNQFATVLIVDDSRMALAHMRHLLEVQRFQVLEAEDGVQALSVLEQHPEVSLIITDYNMPEMDGFELVRNVRSRHKAHRMAVIGVSAAGSGALSAQFLKNGANDFITKPFEAEEFYWRVNQTMEMLDIMASLSACQEAAG